MPIGNGLAYFVIKADFAVVFKKNRVPARLVISAGNNLGQSPFFSVKGRKIDVNVVLALLCAAKKGAEKSVSINF